MENTTMRVFTELFVDELRVLVADEDYEVIVEEIQAGHPYGNPNHGYFYAETHLHNYQYVYGVGNTPEQALQELATNVIMYYELAMQDVSSGGTFPESYQEQLDWWLEHWFYILDYVPDEMADLNMSTHEHWEEWSRKYERNTK
jgi:hypothetical protein